LHVASPNWSATDGCVAVSLDGLSRLLAYCTEATTIDIGDTNGPNM
jgi:L,D-peptidoglycan transpeptidase YkuD (ErfK/YbiS/YcfS/YnhG family)